MDLDKINPQSLWRPHQYFKPHIKHWGEDYVLFDEVSGDTHILDPLAGFVLDELVISASSIDSLSAQLSLTDDCSLNELKLLIADVLSELVQLGFVEEKAAT